MGFSKPSVSIALKKLKESGLIEISVNNNVSLTKEGLEIAEKVYERHKTISYLLTSIGVPEDIALEDACKIEHDLSEITFEKIKEQYNKIKK